MEQVERLITSWAGFSVWNGHSLYHSEHTSKDDEDNEEEEEEGHAADTCQKLLIQQNITYTNPRTRKSLNNILGL